MIREISMVLLDAYSYFKYGISIKSELNRLKKLQYSDKNYIKDLVDEKIIHMVNHAYDNVTFYHSLYKDVDIRKIKDAGKLVELPITTKSMLRSAFPDQVIAPDYKRRAIYDVTSGSTGEPFEFYRDSMSGIKTQASYRFFNALMGVGTNNRFIHIRTPSNITLKISLRDWVVGRNRVSVFDVNREKVDEVLEKINRVKPVFIEGYTASIVNLAILIKENNLVLDSHPKAIVATSENLTESTRGILQEVFQCNVFNRYGSREFSGALAQECEVFEGLHINPVLCHLEIVDENNEPVAEGEQGRILITDLNNMVMPFIRYDIGDAAVKGPETGVCGRNFKIMKKVLGRTGQFVVSKEGMMIPLLPIMSTLFQTYYAPHFYNFQFIQEKKGALTLKVVPTKKYDEKVEEGIMKYLKSLLPEFEMSLDVIDYISPDESGKKKFFIPLEN